MSEQHDQQHESPSTGGYGDEGEIEALTGERSDDESASPRAQEPTDGQDDEDAPQEPPAD